MSEMDNNSWRAAVQPAISNHIIRGHPFVFICTLPDGRVVVTRGAKVLTILQMVATLATCEPENDNDVPWYDLLTDALNIANTHRAKEGLPNAPNPEEDNPF